MEEVGVAADKEGVTGRLRIARQLRAETAMAFKWNAKQLQNAERKSEHQNNHKDGAAR